MMKSRFSQRKKKKLRNGELLHFLKKTLRLFTTILIIFIFMALLLFIVFFRGKYYFGKPVNSVIVYKDSISILRFDPFYDELMILNIDGNVTVESSGGLGSYPLKNVYALSENEKKGELMFKKTIMRNLHLPIYHVIDCRNEVSGKRSLTSIIWSCTRSKDLGDILFLVYTRWKVGNGFVEKNIDDFGGIVADKNNEGSLRLDKNIFEKLALDFSQNMDASDIINVSVVTTEGGSVPLYIADVIKLIGGRVVEETHGSVSEMKAKSCKIVGNDKVFIKNIGKIFDCEAVFSKDETDTKLYFSEKYLTTL